jgi:hypothetical protein
MAGIIVRALQPQHCGCCMALASGLVAGVSSVEQHLVRCRAHRGACGKVNNIERHYGRTEEHLARWTSKGVKGRTE